MTASEVYERQKMQARIQELEAEVDRWRNERHLWAASCKKAEKERDAAIARAEAADKRAEELEAELEGLRFELENPREDFDARRTVESLAAMLGWGNTPSRQMLERSVNALRTRAESAEALLEGALEERVTQAWLQARRDEPYEFGLDDLLKALESPDDIARAALAPKDGGGG